MEDGYQIGIPRENFVQIHNKGISNITNLVESDKGTTKQIAENLRCISGWIPDLTPADAARSTITTPPFVFVAKSQKNLLTACDSMRYYNTTRRPLTPWNMYWTPVMRKFVELRKSLKNNKDGEESDVHKISKSLPIIKRTGSFKDYLNRVIIM